SGADVNASWTNCYAKLLIAPVQMPIQTICWTRCSTTIANSSAARNGRTGHVCQLKSQKADAAYLRPAGCLNSIAAFRRKAADCLRLSEQKTSDYRSTTISGRVLSMIERSSFCSLLGIWSLSSEAL